MTGLTHLDETGAARMVDVGDKAESSRRALARATVRMQAQTLELLLDDGLEKGDVFAVARVAGIQAAKKCADLIPLCHPLMLNAINVDFVPDPAVPGVHVEASCSVSGKTGVEMEALTAASVAALTIYDMCKAVDRGMTIEQVGLWEKEGGNSGAWRRTEQG